jgi:hypothetical protein
MGRKNKAYTVDFMPEYTSRDEMIAHFQRCYHNCSREKANQLLHSEQQLWDRDRARCRLWYNKERESWKGRKTQAATALFGLPSQGGKDNLRNFLTASIKDQYPTTDELYALLESKYGEDKAATKYKRAIDPSRQILKYHRSVRRWSAWGKPEPDPTEFVPETVDGKYGDRVRLYGLMPRGLKHKPGEKFVREESQVLQWMSRQSGESDLAKVDTEYNRLPWAWINSETDEKDSDYRLEKAIRIHDRGTGETIGILTYRDEVSAKPEVKTAQTSKELTDKVLLANLKDDPELFEEYFNEPRTERQSIEIMQENFVLEDPDNTDYSPGVDEETAKRAFVLACQNAILIGFKVPSLGSERVYARKEFWQKDGKQLLARDKEEKGEKLLDIY